MPVSRPFPDTRPSLLASLRDGAEGTGWVEFYQRYAPAIFRVARHRGLAVPEAEDVVQQVMLAISRHIGGFRYDRDRGQFRSWVRQIAETKIIDLTRRERQTRLASDLAVDLAEQHDGRPEPHVAWEEVWEQEWKLQDILYCIDECRNDIAPRTFEAFCLYVVEGLPAKETAERVRMSVNQVHVVRYQIIARIRAMMARLGKLSDEQDTA